MTDIIERAKTCGADGDAIYCWNVAREVADECVALRQQLADTTTMLDEMRDEAATYRVLSNTQARQLAECQSELAKAKENDVFKYLHRRKQQEQSKDD